MLQIKRWAKYYLPLSPIYQHPIFTQPNHQHIMQVNPRLLSAYCLNMLKCQYYNSNKITQILQMYSKNRQCYWYKYVYSIIDTQAFINDQKQSNNSTISINNDEGDEVQVEDRQIIRQKIVRLRCLISKTFHQSIYKHQFNQLAQLYLALLDQHHITQMDNVAIDLSLQSLSHLATFADMKQSALPAIGPHSLNLLHSIIDKCQPAQYFSIISILNRVKSKLDNHPQLKLLNQLVQLQTNHKQLIQQNIQHRVFLRQQSIVFMIWLLHIYQLGDVIYQHIRKNYILVQYQQHSLKLIAQLLYTIQIDDNMHKKYVVILSEIIYRMQKLQQQIDVYQQLDQNMQLSKLLKKLKNKILQIIELQNRQQVVLMLQQLNELQINFYSTNSHKLIQQNITKILSDPYSSILLTQKQIHSIVKISIRIDNHQMHNKIINKFRKQLNTHTTHKLIDYITTTAHIEQGYNITNLSIDNICQLMRIKHYLCTQKLTKISNLKLSPQQTSHLNNLKSYLIQHNTKTNQLLPQALFKSFQM